MSTPVTFRLEVDQETVIVEFLDISRFSHSELTEGVLRALRAPEYAGCRHLLVDCQQLSYANSLFLDLLLQLEGEAHRQQGRFALCCLGEFLNDVFHVTRLSGRWPTYENRESALRELQTV